jgi:hypothetical protein
MCPKMKQSSHMVHIHMVHIHMAYFRFSIWFEILRDGESGKIERWINESVAIKNAHHQDKGGDCYPQNERLFCCAVGAACACCGLGRIKRECWCDLLREVAVVTISPSRTYLGHLGGGVALKAWHCRYSRLHACFCVCGNTDNFFLNVVPSVINVTMRGKIPFSGILLALLSWLVS